MSLKVILNALLDAAISRWPSWKGIFELLRPFIMTNLPTDDGIVVIGAAPESIVTTVVNFLTGLQTKATGWLVKIGIGALIKVVPVLLDGLWDSLFAGQPKPMFAKIACDDFEVIIVAAESELA